MRISDWSSDVCSSDLLAFQPETTAHVHAYAVIEQAFGQPNVQIGTIHFLAGGVIFGRFQVEIKIYSGDQVACQAIQLRTQELEIGRASCRERVCQYV